VPFAWTHIRGRRAVFAGETKGIEGRAQRSARTKEKKLKGKDGLESGAKRSHKKEREPESGFLRWTGKEGRKRRHFNAMGTKKGGGEKNYQQKQVERVAKAGKGGVRGGQGY